MLMLTRRRMFRRDPIRVRHVSLGQALVEFALVIPVLMLILLACIDFGRIMFSYIQINNAAREGAAYAIRRRRSSGSDRPPG